MSKFRGLKDFVGFNSEFRNAINLELNLNHKEKLLSYIPTKSSVDILKRYLKAVQNNTLHASMLIGPYGKGKSHLLLVLLAILSLDRLNKRDKEVFMELLSKIARVDKEAAYYMEEAWKHPNGKFLPIIINCQEDVNQAFLLALNKALNNNGLGELTPKTDFIYAADTIDNWKKNYLDTYKDYHEILKTKKITLNAMKAELLQYNREYLEIFKEIYPELTSGSVFNPLAEAEVTRIYMSVADKLREEYGYRGLYIVFDEFSKFIEGQDKISAGFNMKLVQDVCEMAGDSEDPQIYITLVAHKPIKEYGNKLKIETINSFTGIEGRLDAEISFITSEKNNYELIQNAVIKTEEDLNDIPDEIRDIYFSESAINANFSIPGFESEFTYDDFDKIVVKGCYPLTPIASYLLLNISEKVAQNERTLFTFISKEEQNSMPEYVKTSVGTNAGYSSKWSVTPDLIYDYFTNLFKDELPEIKSIYQRSVTALELARKKYKYNEAPIRILKTLAAMMIVNKEQELPWDENTLRLAVNMNYSDTAKEKFSDAIENLIVMNILDIDGNNFYKFKTIEGKELESVIEERWRLVANETTIRDSLQQVFNTKYVFPKKYNYEFGMTRFFRYSFYDVEDFLSITSADVFFENTLFCDGKILCLYQFDDKDYSDSVKKKILGLKSHKLVVMYAHKPFELKEDVLKLQVVQDIKDDFAFIEKNEKLIPEIEGLEETLLTKISSSLESLFGRFGEYEVLYYFDGIIENNTSGTISECIDDLCNKLYYATPIVNNEFVNKQNITTGATKTVRKNIMERLLSNGSIDDYMAGTSQDATIYRALFVRNGVALGKPEDKIKKVLNIFNNYLEKCAGSRVPLSDLYDVITKEPYGIRRGLIPIYLAYVIGKKTADVVIYFGDKEIPLNADTIINMCDYPTLYEMFVSEIDAIREYYLESLIKLFNIRIEGSNTDSRISQILSGMQKWYRALPQISINSKKDSDYFKEDFFEKAIGRMNNIMQRYEVNPYEAIFVQIPEAYAAVNDYDLCLERIAIFKQKMKEYYPWIVERAISETKKIFINSQDSLYHILSKWYEEQSDMAKGLINDQAVASLMKVIVSMKAPNMQAVSGDTAIIDKITKAVTGVHIDYWNNNSLENYRIKLAELKSKIESIRDDEKKELGGKSIYISRKGQQFYYDSVDSEETELFRDVLAGTIEDFEGLGKNDLIAVLLDEVEKILQSRE